MVTFLDKFLRTACMTFENVLWPCTRTDGGGSNRVLTQCVTTVALPCGQQSSSGQITAVGRRSRQRL